MCCLKYIPYYCWIKDTICSDSKQSLNLFQSMTKKFETVGTHTFCFCWALKFIFIMLHYKNRHKNNDFSQFCTPYGKQIVFQLIDLYFCIYLQVFRYLQASAGQIFNLVYKSIFLYFLVTVNQLILAFLNLILQAVTKNILIFRTKHTCIRKKNSHHIKVIVMNFSD